jgi:cell division protein FtsZ
VTLDGAMGLLVNITGGSSLTLYEVNEAISMAQGAADPDANIIFGSVVDERMTDEVKITVIATGFAKAEASRSRPAPRQASLPVASVAAARREAPPPLPASARPAPAPAEVRAAPARAVPARSVALPPVDDVPPAPRPRPSAPVRAARDVSPYQPGEEDQYDIPAFLRRGGNGAKDA